ncbi:MAG: rod shape-determining protein MreC [Patescibacteria group bacterium]
MTYLQPRNPKSRLSGLLVTAGVILILVVGIQFFFPHFFPGFFTSLTQPFWRMEFSISSGSLNSPASLLSQNEELKRQLAAVDVRLQSAQSLEAENAELKAALGRATSTPRILAAVLKRPPLAPYDELIIDIGKDYAVASGTAVYSPERIRIGTITDVLGQTSKVKLLSSPGEKYEVLIGANKEPATAVGRGGGHYEAKVPQESLISEGDVVINPSINEAPFGVVTAKVSDPAEPFTKVLFAPMVNIYKLRWVLVDKQ